MNFKTTYLLFGVLIVLIGVVAFALWYDPTARNDKSKYVLAALQDKSIIKPEDIDHVEIERRDQPKIVLQRDATGDQWSIVEPKKYRADKVPVGHLIAQIFEATREENVAKPADLSTWGLATPPEETITLNKGNERSFKLYVGKVSPGSEDAVIYVLDPARPKEPMAVKKSALSTVLEPLDNYRDTELLASSTSEFQSVELSKDKDSVGWKKDGTRWVYTNPKNFGDAETGFDDTGAVEGRTPRSMLTVLNDLVNLKAEKNDGKADFIDDVSDFSKYYLDPSKNTVLQIDITRQEEDGKDADGKIKYKTVPVTLLVGIGRQTEEKSGKYYASIKGDKTVVKVAAKNVDPLTKLLSDKAALRDKYLVHMDKDPSAVDIRNPRGSIQLRRTPGPKLPPDLEQQFGRQMSQDQWTLWRDDGTSVAVDKMTIDAPQGLLKLLRQKDLVVDFIDPTKQDKDLGIDRDSIVVEVWDDADGVKKDEAAGSKSEDKPKKPELKSKDPTYRLTFGKPDHVNDKDVVSVKRESKNKDGKYDVTLVYVPQIVLDEAKKGPLDYLDKTLERFAASGLSPWPGVTKVTIQRGGKTAIEVTREKDDAPWKIVEPADLKGRNADKTKVEDVLMKMNQLKATRLVEYKPKDEEYCGFKSSQAVKVEITMTKDGKPATFTYDFGKDAQVGEVYAKQSQRPDMIFAASKSVVEGLPTEIVDTTILQLNTADVEGLKITGWSGLTWELERKDATTWTAKAAPPEQKPDSAKINKFLGELSNLQAKGFVAFKSGPKPEYGFDLPAGGTKIEMKLKGQDPITLTVGKADGDKGYYAMSSRTDGDVFYLAKNLFDDLKKGADYFNEKK
jgi:hypothetical protein